MPRAIGYVRISTNKQLGNTSLEKQKAEIKRYCEENNLSLVKIYDEGARSGENMKDRPVFKEMYHHAFDKEERIDYVVVFKADRISRDNLDALYIFKKLTQANKTLISIADNVDTRDPQAKLLYHIMALVSELEKDLISFRTTTGMEKNAEDGKFNGGKIYGYYSENKELKLIHEEAKVVQYIFEKYTYDQWGYRKIASNLNDQGFKTKNNKHWGITAIKTILNNRFYNGMTKWKGQYKKGKHVKIIDDELWYQTQKMLKLRSSEPTKVHPGNYPLSGLMKCPQCGSPMVQGNSSPRYKYYQCSKNKNGGKSVCSSNLVKKEYAEEFVYSKFFTTLKSLDIATPIISTTISSLQSEVEPLNEKLKSMKKELKEITLEKKNLFLLKRKSTINDLTFEQEMADVQKEEGQLIQFINVLERQIAQQKKTNLKESIKITFEKFELFFKLMSDEDKKTVLHTFIREIHIYQGKKTKDRTIKEVFYDFNLNNISKIA
ncbi:recombinase family protein [Sediminibacillus terrae]|uniref:recombinase family protein n=1 Tax=Sediminibacillus terrae TaxID=1562106 RepID=UPI001297DE17|nr:recombinase family protein [Sediminibacillus terrae]